MNKTYQYITIVSLKSNTKTEHYLVLNNKSNSVLGWIEWYVSWRQYCFTPVTNTIFSAGCLEDVQSFIRGLMLDRKTCAHEAPC